MEISECVLDDDDDDDDFCMNPQYVPMFKDFYTLPVLKAKKILEKTAGFSTLVRLCTE